MVGLLLGAAGLKPCCNKPGLATQAPQMSHSASATTLVYSRPNRNAESWLESSTASFPDVRADRGGVTRPPGEVRDGWVGTMDDPKAPEPQTDATIMLPGGIAPHPMKGRVGGKKVHEMRHVGATAQPKRLKHKA